VHLVNLLTATSAGPGLCGRSAEWAVAWDLKVVGGPGRHALLAVKGVLGSLADKMGVPGVLIVVRGLAHRLRPWR
jgi:hypothetical protein